MLEGHKVRAGRGLDLSMGSDCLELLILHFTDFGGF